jgi:hypothetical protein
MTSTAHYTDPTPITPEAVILTLWTLEANGDLTARQREIILRMLKDAYGNGKKFLMTPQETRAVRQAFSDYLGNDAQSDETENAEQHTAGYTTEPPHITVPTTGFYIPVKL